MLAGYDAIERQCQCHDAINDAIGLCQRREHVVFAHDRGDRIEVVGTELVGGGADTGTEQGMNLTVGSGS